MYNICTLLFINGWEKMKGKSNFHYQTIYEDYRKAILDGSLENEQLLPGENTIASLYSVDRSTVRKALQLLVDEGLVEKKAGKGTIVKRDGEKEEVKDTQNIGFFLPSGNAIAQQFYASLLNTCGKELKRHGYSLIYLTFDESDNVLKTVEKYNLVGIIFVSNISAEQIGAALDAKIPCVLANSYDQRLPSILSDNERGSYLAGRYLLENGHRDVAVVSGTRSYVCSNERAKGFFKAYSEEGIKIPETSFLVCDSWEQEAGREVVLKYLENTKKLPTAFFGFNDRIAFGIISALRQYGLKVPQDVSVIGYDNLNAHLSVVPLTTIEAHVEYLAEAAAEAILWQLGGGSRNPYRISIPVELVIGETVRKIN